jgi:hypothetical protein
LSSGASEATSDLPLLFRVPTLVPSKGRSSLFLGFSVGRVASRSCHQEARGEGAPAFALALAFAFAFAFAFALAFAFRLSS